MREALTEFWPNLDIADFWRVNQRREDLSPPIITLTFKKIRRRECSTRKFLLPCMHQEQAT